MCKVRCSAFRGGNPLFLPFWHLWVHSMAVLVFVLYMLVEFQQYICSIARGKDPSNFSDTQAKCYVDPWVHCRTPTRFDHEVRLSGPPTHPQHLAQRLKAALLTGTRQVQSGAAQYSLVPPSTVYCRPVQSSNVFKCVQTCSKPVQMCSNVLKRVQNLFKCVQICSNVFKYVQTCSCSKPVQTCSKLVQMC